MHELPVKMAKIKRFLLLSDQHASSVVFDGKNLYAERELFQAWITYGVGNNYLESFNCLNQKLSDILKKEIVPQKNLYSCYLYVLKHDKTKNIMPADSEEDTEEIDSEAENTELPKISKIHNFQQLFNAYPPIKKFFVENIDRITEIHDAWEQNKKDIENQNRAFSTPISQRENKSHVWKTHKKTYPEILPPECAQWRRNK